MRKHWSTNKSGFTIAELLVVIAVVAFVVALVMAGLDPTARFQYARDAARQTDVQDISEAIASYQMYQAEADQVFSQLLLDDVYMITSGGMVSGCDDYNVYCLEGVTSDSHCIDLSWMEGSYLDEVPVSPTGQVAWDRGRVNVDKGTGYLLSRSSDGSVEVTSCEHES